MIDVMMMKIICRLFALILIYSCSKNETPVGTVQFELKTELWPEEGGAITPVAGNYTSNIIKSIYARPNPGWVFERWEGAISGRENPTQISFYRDHAIRAVFKKDTFKIRTLAGGNGKGSELNQLFYPTGIALDPSGDLYVSDMYNHRIQRWRPGATFGITAAGGNGFGNGPNQLDEPGKITVDTQGNLYIADTRNHRIQKWEHAALSGSTIAGGKGMGNQTDQLNKPFGIAIDNKGVVYVSEIGNHRVTKWIPDATEGEVIAGGNGEGNGANQLAFPLGIAVGRDGSLYVADTYNHRIQKWNLGAKKGITILSADDLEDNIKRHYFSGISLVDDNLLLVTDYEQKRILQYDLTTKAIQILAASSSLDNENEKLSQPYQVALDPLGSIIIADAKNNRIQKWKPESK